MLTAQLREMKKDDIIVRKAYAEIPPKVEYSTSKNGESVFPVLEAIEKWGRTQKRLTINRRKLLLYGFKMHIFLILFINTIGLKVNSFPFFNSPI